MAAWAHILSRETRRASSGAVASRPASEETSFRDEPREEGAIEGSTNLRAGRKGSARGSQERKSTRSSLWHEKSEQEGRTRTEMNRSRSTATTGAARQARPSVLRDRPAREGLESTHRRVVEASRGAGACEGGPTRGAKRRSGEDEDAPALPLQ